MISKIFPLALVLIASTAPAEAALLAYYPFNGNFNDASGNNNHLAVAVGSPTITTASDEVVVGGGALVFDSTTLTEEYLNLANPITFRAPNPWSVSFWARRRPGTDVASGMVLGNPSDTTDFIWLPNNPAVVQGLRFRSSANTTADFGGIPDDGLFHHWVVIHNGSGTISAYRDNVALTNLTTTGSLSITSLGQAYNNPRQSMDGQIDELYIYNEAISTAKVSELYAAGTNSSPTVTRVRAFLLGGQSNADGRAPPTGLPTSPVNLQQPQTDVDFFYKVEGATATLTTLRTGLSETSQFGPEITLGRRLADFWSVESGTRVAIIKYANGGTSLNIDWMAGGTVTTNLDGKEYITFQQTVSQGLAALAVKYPAAVLDLQGMVWMQGESDAVNSYGNQYQTNLTKFIADVRANYGAELPFIAGRLSTNQTSLNDTPAEATQFNLVRNAQTAVAATIPRVSLINTDGYGMNGDNLHFNASGQQALGNDSATALFSYVPFRSSPTLKRLGNGDIEVTVTQPFPGFLYTLQYSAALLPGGWSNGDSETATSTAPVVLTYTPGIGETTRFFRVARSPAP